MTALAFVCLAAGASIGRWLTVERLRSVRSGLGTIAVNVVGAFALGVLVGADADAMLLAGVAALGSFTTFSTMALDVTTAPRHDAVAYLATTLSLGLTAAWVGLRVGGWL